MRAQATARPGSSALAASAEFALSPEDFRRIAGMIHADAGIHLSEGKSALVYARLAKRLRALRLESFSRYCDLVESPAGAAERGEMLTSLTTNVTKFFREPHHFEHLKSQILAPLARGPRRARVRLWSAACSTGQEPYSIAFSLLSVWPDAVHADVKILATDIDAKVLATAEAGVYAAGQMEGSTEEMRRKFFEPAGPGGERRVIAAARNLITFRRLNLVETWPMKGPFQAIFCRNVVIYFDEPTQHGVWAQFAPRLAPEGALYIGHSERVGGPAAKLLRADDVSTYRPAGAPRP